MQEKGYYGYMDFINRRRIDEFLKIEDSDKYVNVLDTFFKVGFRSKATALRNFKEYTGMLPSEYLQLKLKKKTKTLWKMRFDTLRAFWYLNICILCVLIPILVQKGNFR